MDDLRLRLEKALAGQYTFERELGGGGMSRTYVAKEKALDRRVVVKVLAAGEIDGFPWFTMPYVNGDSLCRRLRANRGG